MEAINYGMVPHGYDITLCPLFAVSPQISETVEDLFIFIFLQVLTGPFLAELGISASCASSVLIIDLRLCACISLDVS